MPSVQDIIEFVQDLETKPVLVRDERCLLVRNRNASCRLCDQACPAPEAILLAPNSLRIDFEKCAGCGACTAACPTEALVPLEPMDADLAAQGAAGVLSLRERGVSGHAVIACARAAAKRVADPRTFAEVPCLCRVDASLLMDVAAHGVERITLVDADCTTCKFGSTQDVAHVSVEAAQGLLKACASTTSLECAGEFPSECLIQDEAGLLGQARREFFSRTRSEAKNAAAAAAKRALQMEDATIPLLERLQSSNGMLPHFAMARHESLISSVASLGLEASQVATPLWGFVHIDEDVCNACGICATFCPTGALAKTSKEDAKQAGCHTLLEFAPRACTACEACADICPKQCLTVEHVLHAYDLVDNAIQLFALHK